jgi:hypothetical protein
MKATDFDQKFDDGEEDIIDDLDLTQLERPGHQPQRIQIDFPTWMITALDYEASRLGISREAVIKVWIAEHLAARTHASSAKTR